MAFKSLLPNPGSGVALGLGIAISSYLIYQSALPSHADMRQGNPNNDDLESARKGAAVKSAAVLGVVFLLTHDLNTLIVGGLAIGGIDYMAKHHNAINPATGKLDSSQNGRSIRQQSNLFSLPDYSQTEAN